MGNADKTLEQHMKETEWNQHVNGTTITKREKFAMAAMQGLLCGAEEAFPEYQTDEQVRDHFAKISVQYADALLKELEETK